MEKRAFNPNQTRSIGSGFNGLPTEIVYLRLWSIFKKQFIFFSPRLDCKYFDVGII